MNPELTGLLAAQHSRELTNQATEAIKTALPTAAIAHYTANA